VTSSFGYPVRVAGIVVANAESWVEEAGNDMPEILDATRAHVLLTAITSGNPASVLIPNSSPGSGTDQYTVVPQTAPVLHIRRAVRTLPLLLLGAVNDQVITWSSPMPSAVYTVELAPGTGLLGNATLAVLAGTQTASGVTVRVTAAVLLAAGAVVDVTAYTATA
jgi:hypothetical protein